MASSYTVNVLPDASGWSARLEAQLDGPTRRIADALERRLRNAIQNGLSGFGGNARVQGTRMARDFSDSFAHTAKARIEAALRSLPTVQIGVATTAAEQHLRDLSARLKTLGEDIELGVDDKKAISEIEALKRELSRLARNSTDVRVRVNTGTALAELEALKRSLDGFDRKGRFGRMFDDLRDKLPIVDTAITKLGKLGDVAGKASPVVMPYLIISALSLIGPLAGAATAALFGIAGAAGVAGLAFLGLKKQFDDGIGQGVQMRREFSAIGAEVATLGQVAANAVGPGINNALDTVRRALPGFTPLIDVVGRNLSNAVRTFTLGLVTAFQRAQPLIVQFGGYIEDAAKAFEGFTQSKDFGKFLDYASRELPKVGDTIKSLAGGVISVAQAMSTLGDNTLATLKGLGDLVGVIGKIGSAKPFGDAGGGAADQLGFTSAGGLLGNFSNPVGFALKGIDAARNPDQFADPKALAAAKDAAKAYIDAQQAAFKAASNSSASALGVNNDAYTAATAAMKSTADQLAQTTLQMQLQNDAAGLLKAALDGLSGKNLGVAQSLTSFQTGLLSLDDTFAKGAFSATAFTDSAVAQRGALESAVTAAQAHAEAVGAQTGHTEDATAALKADYAQIVANTGATGAQKAAIMAYIESIGAIPAVKPTQLEINTAAAIVAVEGFKRTIASIPATKGIELYVSKSGAEAAIQNFVNTPRTAYVQVQTVGLHGGSGGRAVLNANGGILDGQTQMYAKGGINNPVQKYANGALLPNITVTPRAIYGEAGPEAYIPLANDSRRARAEDILGDVAKRFGGAYLPAMASVNRMTAAVAAAPGSTTGSDLIGVAVTIDAGSVGTLTGHVTGVADTRIMKRESDLALQRSGGSASVIR